MDTISWEDFEKIDIRVGTIVEASDLAGVRKPAYKLLIDFGELIGKKTSSAQITGLYKAGELQGKQVIAVINFPTKQIGRFFSECLVMGVYNKNNEVVLLKPDIEVSNGSKIG